MARWDQPELGVCPTTHWSLVARAGAAPSAAKREALAQLITRYRPALRAHLVFRKGMDRDAAEDALQGFLVKVLEQDTFAGVERQKGRFRTFLLTTLDRFVIDEHRRRSAQIRGGGRVSPLDDDTAGRLADDADAPEFDTAWAQEVVRQTLRLMEEECTGSGRPHVWELFRVRILAPAMDDADAPAYEDLAARLGFASPTQAANALVTAKRMFQRLLRQVIGEYALADEVDLEIGSLREILAAAGRA